MKLFIAVVAVLLVSFGVVYMVTKGSPQPTKSDIAYVLDQYLKYSPVRWDFKFGKETKASNGAPAWPIIFEILTSTAGENEKVETFTLLFYREGYEWKTEKIEYKN